MSRSFDGAEFRRVLGHYPTGICAVTASTHGRPVGMIVGSFTSVSLDPPLIAFFPGRFSTTWPRIEAAGCFCVNVLADGQQAVCRSLSAKEGDKFAHVPHEVSVGGLPKINDAVAWIECTLHAVHEAGDHYIAVGMVNTLAVDPARAPLLFHRGGYGGFAPA